LLSPSIAFLSADSEAVVLFVAVMINYYTIKSKQNDVKESKQLTFKYFLLSGTAGLITSFQGLSHSR
jgi:hypothetical protein